MKRTIGACLCITLQFVPDRTLPRREREAKVLQEVEEYKNSLDSNQMIYEQQYFDDGSVILYVRKRVKDLPVGNYFTKKII